MNCKRPHVVVQAALMQAAKATGHRDVCMLVGSRHGQQGAKQLGLLAVSTVALLPANGMGQGKVTLNG
jgi:hypothetical protein